jgi:hypothetical protein
MKITNMLKSTEIHIAFKTINAVGNYLTRRDSKTGIYNNADLEIY